MQQQANKRSKYALCFYLIKTIIILPSIIFLFGCSATKSTNGDSNKTPIVLVFYKTKGFYHQSIPSGIAALQKLGAENKIRIDTTNNADAFTDENLKRYNAVVFLSTTGDVLNNEQQAAFERFIKHGAGFLGIHSATDTEYDWPWYNQLVGAYFLNHPKVQQATINVVDHNHPATKMLPDRWDRKDEWYNFKNISTNIKVLATLDESSYEGGKNGSYHPIAWYHSFDGGRAFYTALGHTNESFSEPLFLQHLLGGLRYVIGE
jgi:uncharacterized protein